MAKTADNIDWEDNAAVADARGDEVKDESASETVQEQEEAPEKEEKTESKAPPADEQQPTIPKSRFDAKNKKLKEVEQENERLKQQLEEQTRTQTPPPAHPTRQEPDRATILTEAIAELDEQYFEAVADNDKKLAADLRAEQRQYEQELFRMEMQETSTQTRQQTMEGMRTDLAIDMLEEQHPELNPDSDEYDEGLTKQIQELRAGFLHTGKYTETQALLKAVRVYVPDTGSTSDTPDPDKQETTRTTRQKQALKKATEASNKQPPDLRTVGDDSDQAGITKKVDASKLTIDDLDKLTDEDLKRLRGDYFGQSNI